MKNVKITKKQIKETLKSKNPTEIYKLCAQLGIDVSNKSNVMNFIKENAHANYVCRSAYKIAYDSKNIYKRDRLFYVPAPKMPIYEAIQYAKYQKKRGEDNYSKKLFIGNRNIYWCHPSYGHSDYNKGISFENTAKNREIAELINKFLNY